MLQGLIVADVHVLAVLFAHVDVFVFVSYWAVSGEDKLYWPSSLFSCETKLGLWRLHFILFSP